jgi:hypothetical protein
MGCQRCFAFEISDLRFEMAQAGRCSSVFWRNQTANTAMPCAALAAQFFRNLNGIHP